MGSFFWEITDVTGFVIVDIPFPGGLDGLNKNSVVLASVTEIQIAPGQTIGSSANVPILGEANNIVIRNIVPEDPVPGATGGRFKIAIDTNWTGVPLNLRVNFTFINA